MSVLYPCTLGASSCVHMDLGIGRDSVPFTQSKSDWNPAMAEVLAKKAEIYDQLRECEQQHAHHVCLPRHAVMIMLP